MNASQAALIFSRLECAGFEALEIRCDREHYDVAQEFQHRLVTDYAVIALYPLTLEQLTHLQEAGLQGAGGPDGYTIRRYP